MRRLVLALTVALAFMAGITLGIQAQDDTVRLAPLEAGQSYLASEQELITARIYEQVVNSVVNVSVAGNLSPLGTGTGFVIDPAGYIVTNNHVAEDASYIEVTFFNGTRAAAALVGNDPDSDLAVIKVDPVALSFELQAVELADSDEIFVGQFVLAIGSPFGQSFTLTRGIVSALGRQLQTVSRFSIPMVIQTDAAINPGNSGGPLLDYSGQVIGVNTAILSGTGTGSGVGFAVPSNSVRRIVPYLIENGEYQHVWLGITGTSVVPEILDAMELPREISGVMVVNVVDEGPADKAGVLGTEETIGGPLGSLPVNGDIITRINGVSVRDMDQLIAYLEANTMPGDTATLELIRSGEALSIPVVLEPRAQMGS